MRAAALAFALGSLLLLNPVGWAAIPTFPGGYILDQTSRLTEDSKKVLNQVLSRHERITGEQIVIAVFQNIPKKERHQLTQDAFLGWQVGKRHKNNGVLIAIFPPKDARIEIGYGLENVLSASKAEDIVDDQILPPLKEGHLDQALIDGILELLRTLDSPLITSGKAAELLGQVKTVPKQESGMFGAVALLLAMMGAIAFAFTWAAISSSDAHYSQSGWHHLGILEHFKLWAPTAKSKRAERSFMGGGAIGDW